MNIDTVYKVATVTAALIAPITGALLFWWSNIREHAKRLQIIDLATKRVAFWDQFLKVEIAASTVDSDEYKQSKDKAYQALQRVHSDAERDLKQLVWEKNIRQKIGYVVPTFKFRGLRNLPVGTKVACLLLTVFSWIWLLFALVFASFLMAPNLSGIQVFVSFVCTFWSIYAAGAILWAGEMLRHQRPIPPTLDEL